MNTTQPSRIHANWHTYTHLWPTKLQHLWDDSKANGGLNGCSSNIFNNIHNNNNNGSNGHNDGACIFNNHNNHLSNGSDKLPPELFAISYSERMRRHSTMSHKIVIHPNSNHQLKFNYIFHNNLSNFSVKFGKNWSWNIFIYTHKQNIPNQAHVCCCLDAENCFSTIFCLTENVTFQFDKLLFHAHELANTIVTMMSTLVLNIVCV